MVNETYRFDEFFSLIELVGSFTQITSVPSMMIPVALSCPSNVETARTVAFNSCPRKSKTSGWSGVRGSEGKAYSISAMSTQIRELCTLIKACAISSLSNRSCVSFRFNRNPTSISTVLAQSPLPGTKGSVSTVSPTADSPTHWRMIFEGPRCFG